MLPDQTTAEFDRHNDATLGSRTRHDRWFVLIFLIFIIPLVVAVVSDAALTWDGAFYLFRMLDTGKPFIAHDRLIDAPLHWPIVLADRFTDSMAVLRATFGLVHVLTPIVSLALSWWVVRKVAPALIIWPILGIGLATLPGQINFISEGIKAHQLIWPVLLAVLVGLPGRTIPMAAMVSLVIMYLHPAAVPIFAAVAAAGFVIAWLRPADRERLVPFATCLAIAAVLRYGMIGGGYEQGEMNFQTMKRQWLNSATGLPGVSLFLTFAAAAVLLGVSLLRSLSRWVALVPLALIAFSGAFLTVWALEDSLWWDALEFRGPTNILSLGMAGFAFADTCLTQWIGPGRLRVIPPARRIAGTAVAAAFAIVLSVQSLGYGRVIDEMNTTLAAAPKQCVEISALPGMPESPLNLWSTPSLSLLYQGWTPSRIVLMNGDCERARADGTLGINAPGVAYDSDRIDLVPLQWELGGHGACWWDEPGGWHPAEVTEIGRRRWSDNTASIRIFVGEPGVITFSGTIVSFTPNNTVDVRVNGELQETIEFDEDTEKSMQDVTLDLQIGENTISFDSVNEAGRAPGDPRDLAFSLFNVEPTIDGSQQCSYRP